MFLLLHRLVLLLPEELEDSEDPRPSPRETKNKMSLNKLENKPSKKKNILSFVILAEKGFIAFLEFTFICQKQILMLMGSVGKL